MNAVSVCVGMLEIYLEYHSLTVCSRSSKDLSIPCGLIHESLKIIHMFNIMKIFQNQNENTSNFKWWILYLLLTEKNRRSITNNPNRHTLHVRRSVVDLILRNWFKELLSDNKLIWRRVMIFLTYIFFNVKKNCLSQLSRRDPHMIIFLHNQD